MDDQFDTNFGNPRLKKQNFYFLISNKRSLDGKLKRLCHLLNGLELQKLNF